MKKSKNKLSLSLITTFIASLAMTSCDVTPNKKAVVTFTGYDGEEVSVLTDDVYYDYMKDSATGISKIYDAMLETLIRYEFQHENSVLNTSSEKTKQTYAQIKKTAKAKLAGLKKETKDKGGDYNKEWEALLESYGVETTSELLEKLIYNEEKSEVEDWYFEVNQEELLSEYIGLTDNTSNSKFPYHIRHILTSVSGGTNDFATGTISETEALNLHTIVQALYDGKSTFGEIAHDFSGDKGSAEKYGSLGIMDTSTSFVNEFKLGIYAYDLIYSGNAAATNTIKNGLGLNGEFEDVNPADPEDPATTVSEKLTEIGLGRVPFAAFQKVYENRDVTTDDKGVKVNDGLEKYYPRNIYWNKYLNRHNVFVITNSSLVEDSYNGTVDPSENDEVNVATTGKTGFRYVANLSANANQLVLTDELGRPIVCVRSQHGIHFMILEKSVTESDLVSYYNPDALIPGDDGYDPNVKTYVTYENTSAKATYKERAEELRNTIKSFDETYSYRLFEYFVQAEANNISFNVLDDGRVDLLSLVNTYINSLREHNSWSTIESMNSSWRDYLELINVQEANRIEDRLVKELCALKFKDYSSLNGDGQLFGRGGACYYEK